MNHGKDDGAEQSCHKTVYMKARYQSAGDQQNDRVDHQKEQAKGQYPKREGEKFEEKSQRRIQKADHQGCDQSTAEAGNLKTGNQTRNNDECNCAK